MVDSVSVAVGGEVAPGVTDVVVLDESGGEGQESERDAGAEAFDGAAAVVFEGSWALQVQNAVEHLGGDDALGDVGGGELNADRHAVRRAQHVEPKAPEVAAVALAPPV